MGSEVVEAGDGESEGETRVEKWGGHWRTSLGLEG